MQHDEIQNSSPDLLPPVSQTYDMAAPENHRMMNLFILFIISMSMIPWLFGERQVFGFLITGWAWVIPLIISSLIFLGNIRSITFPINIWLPWIFLLAVYWFQDLDNMGATQSFLQMLCPLVVGCAASVFRPDNLQFDKILSWFTNLIWLALILLLIRMPILLSGQLPDYGFMGPSMIGFLLFGACYSAFYACGSTRHLLYYFAALGMAVISHGRGPILAMLSCLPFTFAPLKMKRRVIIVLLMSVIAVALFNTERMQKRMFYSGNGEIADIQLNNPNFKTHARAAMWDALWMGVRDEPLLGNGWNSHRNVLLRGGYQTYAPHNDWLKLLHDIGVIGIGIYFFTMLFQVFFLVRIAHWSTGAHQMLAFGAASAFIPYMIIMFTDNVVLYVQYFGNVHFALIGIIYGFLKRGVDYEHL